MRRGMTDSECTAERLINRRWASEQFDDVIDIMVRIRKSFVGRRASGEKCLTTPQAMISR